MNDLIVQLSEFAELTKRLLNNYPYKVLMSEQSVVEFSDKFCPFTAHRGVGSSLMGIPIVQSSLVPDHEAWVYYHDDTAPDGFRVERMGWGDS